jgi:hypothetical protein
MRLRCLAAAVLLASGLASHAEGKPSLLPLLVPGHVRVQFAGASGLVSLGAGYGFWNGKVEPGLSYGWVPARLGGAPIHTLAQKTTVSPFRTGPAPAWSWYPLVLGYSAHIALGSNYDLVLERKFRGYYWPSALHFWLSAGTKVRKDFPSGRFFSAVTLLAEAGTLEAYLEPVLTNRSIGWDDVVSLSFSVQAHR